MTVEHLSALPPGFNLQEYRIDRILGYGGFGITYLATDTNLDKAVAIKEYLPNELAVRTDGSTVKAKTREDQDDFRWGLDRFLDEARTLARFRHPNLVPVHRFFEAHGTAYMVMEYEPGESLADILRRTTERAPEAEVRGLLDGVLSGLEAVHAAGFLHRDIKPSNIIIRPDGTPVLIDFGAARQAVGRRSRNITSIVTPGYAPLEQYTVEGNQGPWTDLYATGAVLYQIATGKAPPDATSRARNDPYRPLGADTASPYSQQLREAIDWALRFDEEDRPQSVAQWRDALDGPAAIPPVSANDQATRLVGADRQTVATPTVQQPGGPPNSPPSGPAPSSGGVLTGRPSAPPSVPVTATPASAAPAASSGPRVTTAADLPGGMATPPGKPPSMRLFYISMAAAIVVLGTIAGALYVGFKDEEKNKPVPGPVPVMPTPAPSPSPSPGPGPTPAPAPGPTPSPSTPVPSPGFKAGPLFGPNPAPAPAPTPVPVPAPMPSPGVDHGNNRAPAVHDSTQKGSSAPPAGLEPNDIDKSTSKGIQDGNNNNGNDNNNGSVTPSGNGAQASAQARDVATDARRLAGSARTAADGARDRAQAARQIAPQARTAAGAGSRTQTYGSGTVYHGAMVNNKRKGLGVLETPKGYRYEGQWDADSATGLGVSTDSSNNERYEGDWRNGDRSGRGVYSWPTGQRFEGEYRDGQRNGLGVLYFANGDRQEGQWQDGKANGRGVLYFTNGERYEGEFSNGQFNGRGIYTWPDGQRFEGSYRDDQRHGYGVLYLADGSSQAGFWEGTKLTRPD